MVMVYSDFPFNPVKDKTPVSTTGFVDLKSAMVNHTIPVGVASADSDYNGISDPASILGKPRDVFEAMDMQKHIRDFKPSETETPPSSQ